MNASFERFAMRQALRASSSERSLLIPLPSAADAHRLDNAPVDQAYLSAMELALPTPPTTYFVNDAVTDARLPLKTRLTKPSAEFRAVALGIKIS